MFDTVKRQIILLIVLVGIALSQSPAKGVAARGSARGSNATASTTVQFYGVEQGFNLKIWLGNMSTFGINYAGGSYTPDGFGCEYPAGSGIEHLMGAAPWVAAIVDTGSAGNVRRIKAVTTGYEGWAGPYFEMHGNPDGSDSIRVTSADSWNGHNKRGYDDDMDGKIDEDEYDGIDNDHDGLIDEDYGALSDKDVYVGYSDYYGDPNPIPGHHPLGLRVWQKSYAWHKGTPEEGIIFFEYYLVNTNLSRSWDSVFVGMFVDADVGPKARGGFYLANYSAYDPLTRTAYTDNPLNSPSTPIGFTLISAPKMFDSLRLTFVWYPGALSPATDSSRYNLLSSGTISPDEYPNLSDTRFLLGTGPYFVAPQETLHFVYAMEAGQSVRTLTPTLLGNAVHAIAFYKRGFTHAPAPPSPPLHLTKEFNRVHLDWKWMPGDRGIDPVEAWDDSNAFLSSLPDTDWRRINPPAGHTRGGRMFEGFRLYRSESATYDSTTFVPLRQYDVNDGLNIPYQTGLQYTFTDSNLAPGKSYWYAVTSYSIPYLGPQHASDVMESNISDNATAISIAHQFRLYDAYPNPFNPKTTIEYDIPIPEYVKLTVYDLLGREVARLVDGAQDVGRYRVEWDAESVASGVYFYRLSTGDFIDVKKIMVLR